MRAWAASKWMSRAGTSTTASSRDNGGVQLPNMSFTSGHLSAWDEVVSEIVIHDNEIADLWQRKSNLACNAGTWVHAMFEHMMNCFHIEWTIHAVNEDLAGSIDLALLDAADGLVLFDWKRSEKSPSSTMAMVSSCGNRCTRFPTVRASTTDCSSTSTSGYSKPIMERL